MARCPADSSAVRLCCGRKLRAQRRQRIDVDRSGHCLSRAAGPQLQRRALASYSVFSPHVSLEGLALTHTTHSLFALCQAGTKKVRTERSVSYLSPELC